MFVVRFHSVYYTRPRGGGSTVRVNTFTARQTPTVHGTLVQDHMTFQHDLKDDVDVSQ